MTRKEIGRIIAIRRMERGLTQEALALQLNCSQSLIGAMELGHKAGINTILKTLEHLGLELVVR